MSERLQSPERCDNIRALGAAACEQCVADCPLARLAQSRPAMVPAGNERAATAALMDDAVLSVGAEFGGRRVASGGVSESPSEIISDREVEAAAIRKKNEERQAQKQREAEKRTREHEEREALARERARNAANAELMRRQIKVAEQKKSNMALGYGVLKHKDEPSLLDQVFRDLAAMFSPPSVR